ncbi:MAG: phage holin family protein [Acidaminococcaceae bacterium]|nr:phage holin family protein [Acidaminococcaceae bacterium]
MEQVEAKTIQAAFSAALAMLTAYFGIVAVPITVLVVAMAIDYGTGMAAAWKQSELSSKRGIIGIVKKIGYLALVCVGMLVDWLIYCGLQAVNVNIGYTFFFGVLVTIWLIINELISILENLGTIGVPLPKFLLTIVKKLKVTAENVVNHDESEEKNDE